MAVRRQTIVANQQQITQIPIAQLLSKLVINPAIVPKVTAPSLKQIILPLFLVNIYTPKIQKNHILLFFRLSATKNQESKCMSTDNIQTPKIITQLKLIS